MLRYLQRLKHKKGFTLVELLIVIVVIGILSAMMMLSSTEAVTSAKAAAIISDLRNHKTAALSWFADNLEEVEQMTSGFALSTDVIHKYMGSDGREGYYFTSESDANESGWYVWCEIPDTNVGAKLKARANSVGLASANNVTNGGNNPSDIKSGDDFDATNDFVGMFIR